jgi:Arc/MetJ family transcription regulator
VGRESIEIDADLIARVMRLRGLPTKRLAVDFALRRLLAQPLSRDEALAMRGSGWDVDGPGSRPGR